MTPTTFLWFTTFCKTEELLTEAEVEEAHKREVGKTKKVNKTGFTTVQDSVKKKKKNQVAVLHSQWGAAIKEMPRHQAGHFKDKKPNQNRQHAHLMSSSAISVY